MHIHCIEELPLKVEFAPINFFGFHLTSKQNKTFTAVMMNLLCALIFSFYFFIFYGASKSMQGYLKNQLLPTMQNRAAFLSLFFSSIILKDLDYVSCFQTLVCLLVCFVPTQWAFLPFICYTPSDPPGRHEWLRRFPNGGAINLDPSGMVG